MRTKITVPAGIILAAILSVESVGIGILNLIAFTAVQGAGFLLSLLTKKAASRPGIRFLVSAAAFILFLILGTNRQHLWNLYFMLTLPACGISALIDVFLWCCEAVCYRKEDVL